MAEPLKNSFDAAMIRSIAGDLARADPNVDAKTFVREALRGLEDLELTERAKHVAAVMRRHLPSDFETAAQILISSLGAEHSSTETFGMTPFRYLPHVYYAAAHGLDAFEPAMRLQYELTKRFTAEFSIRAYLIHHPERTLARLRQWATDPNVHVRRLVSEGSRPRLPWAARLPEFQRDPTPVLELLEILKDDAERYVQRSVANNLNDIGKDHPDRAVEVCQRWAADAPPGRRYIVEHALRSLVKAGHRGALGVVGFAQKPAVRVRPIAVPRQARIGDKVHCRAEITSTSDRSQDLLVDYAVHYRKASGAARPKVFKLTRVCLPARRAVEVKALVSFAVHTTRTPVPGPHAVTLLVNGVSFAVGTISVRPQTKARPNKRRTP